MNIKELIIKSRSYRKFYQDCKIGRQTLIELVDIARLSSSAANLQPLRYILSFAQEKNNLIFSTLSWAGYLKDWPGPKEGERPAAYIIMLALKGASKWTEYDAGIAAANILLGAVEKGLGGCMIGAVNRGLLRKHLTIDEKYDIVMVVALGKPKERIVLTDVIDDNIKYYRDRAQVHHVPKRSLNEIILKGL